MARVPIPLGRSFGKGRSLTPERLKELLHYDPETGMFTWRVAMRGTRIGDVARCPSQGRVVVRVDRILYQAHRLAWFYVMGAWPKDVIDHKDGNPSNNRWENLREATQTQNMANMKRPAKNSTGFKGVGRHQGKYRAYIGYQGKFVHLGVFDEPAVAHEAYKAAAVKYYGEFANSGDGPCG